MDLTFADFDYAADNCIRLDEFQDVMESAGLVFDTLYGMYAGLDDCMTKDEWRPLALAYKNNEGLFSRADFFDRVYGGNCEYWLSDAAAAAGFTVPAYCNDDSFIESTATDAMSV